MEASWVARSLLAQGGSAIVADERVGESVTTAREDVERLTYRRRGDATEHAALLRDRGWVPEDSVPSIDNDSRRSFCLVA